METELMGWESSMSGQPACPSGWLGLLLIRGAPLSWGQGHGNRGGAWWKRDGEDCVCETRGSVDGLRVVSLPVLLAGMTYI